MRTAHFGRSWALVAIVLAGFAAGQAAGQPSFQGIGFLNHSVEGSLANKISKNGNVVVGESFIATGSRAIAWTAADGLMNLGVLPGGTADSVAYGVSADGSVIVGQSDDGNFAEGGTAFRWTQATGMVALGNLGGPTNYGYAYQTSDDGTIIMGSMDDGHPGQFGGIGFQTFRWTAATGMQPFGQAPGGVILGAASVSGDGLNYWASRGQLQTYRRTLAGPWTLQPAEFNTITWIRNDGQVMFTSRCFGSTTACPRAHRWTAATGAFTDLGIVSGSSDRGDTVLRGVSDDGTVAVGLANFDPNDGGVAFIWDTQHGIRNLQSVLVDTYGLAGAAGWSQIEPTGLSADGRVICGIGFNLDGAQEGWVANLRGATALCRADFNHSGSVTVQDIFEFLGAWFAGAASADFNGVGGVTLQDIFDFLAAWFTGCP